MGVSKKNTISKSPGVLKERRKGARGKIPLGKRTGLKEDRG